MTFRNFATPHCHIASLDSASTPQAFAKRELELGTGTLTVTDHGTLQATRQVYNLCKKEYKGVLTPILGLEGYFRDDDCPILKAAGIQKNENGSFADFLKYGHLTLHAQDEAAYETIVRLLSDADSKAEKHGSERKPLFNWRDIEEIGAQNVTMGSGCLIGVTQRFIMEHGRFDLAEAYYKRMRSYFKPGNFFVEVFPHVCNRDWDSAVYVKFEDGTEERYASWKTLKTDKKPTGKKEGNKEGYKAKELASNWARSKDGHGCLRAVMQDRKWVEIEKPKRIASVELREGFIMNDCQPWAPDGDLQYGCNKAVIELAKKYGDKILISDDSHFVSPDEKIIQDIRLLQHGGNWRFANSHYRYSSEDAWKYFANVLKISQTEFEGWIENNAVWAEGFKNFKFKERQTLPVKFYPADTLRHTVHLIKKHGRMQDTPEYAERLRAELELLHQNGTIDLLPYFFLDEEVVSLYERKGKLTGPGRGSAAGLLLTYLLGITHVDPLRYGLSKDRFLTIDRIQSKKLPDIDQDLPERDETLVPWLDKRFGDHYAQISVDTKLKLKSSVKDVARWKRNTDGKGGFVPPAIEVLTKKFVLPPQGVTDQEFVFGYKGSDGWKEGSINYDVALQQYIRDYADEWELVKKCLGLTRQKGRHASAFCVANEPIKNFIPLTSVSDVKVTQFTAESVEAAGGLKMDFLVVNALNDIGACIRLIQNRNPSEVDWGSAYNLPDDPNVIVPGIKIGGKFVPLLRIVPFKNEYVDIYDLPEDQAVFRETCEGKTETVFQFNTPGAKKWLRHFDAIRRVDEEGIPHKALDSIEGLAAFTALDRPGPLDAYVEGPGGVRHNMLIEFANRAKGKDAIGLLPILYSLIPETHGVITYQEQLTRIFREIGKSTAIEAENFRVHVSKKMMMDIIRDKDIFMKGANETVGPQVAGQLWSMMETFGQYGFNKSHAVCYVIIGYACAWLKHHFPLEWWTAVLRNADRKEIEDIFWPYCGHLIDPPDINLSEDSFVIQNNRIRAPLSLIQGIGPTASAELDTSRPYKDLHDFCSKIQEHRSKTVTITNAEGKQKSQKGRSALHRGIVYKLICSGVMDSLFAPGLETFEKLRLYEQTVATLTKKKKPEPVDPFFNLMNPITRYQLRKGILAAYGADLIPVVKEMGLPWVSKSPSGYELIFKGEHFGLARANELEILNQISPLPPHGLRPAVIAYVASDERQTYQGNKQMAKLILDIEGHREELIKWPNKEGKLPPKFSDSLQGAVICAILSRFSEGKPMVIDEIFVVEPKLSYEKEE